MKRVLLFLVLAVFAAAAGIGFAEAYMRLFPKEQDVALAAQPSNTKAEKMAREAIAEMRRDHGDVVEDIRKDCSFRYPSRDDWSIRDSCATDQGARLRQIRNLWNEKPDNVSRGVIVYCMDRNRTMNDYDWRSVGWCYERNIVAARRDS